MRNIKKFEIYFSDIFSNISSVTLLPVTFYFMNNPFDQGIKTITNRINHPKTDDQRVPTKRKSPIEHQDKPHPNCILFVDSPSCPESQFSFPQCFGQADKHNYSPFCSVYFEISVKSLSESMAFFFFFLLSSLNSSSILTASLPYKS